METKLSSKGLRLVSHAIISFFGLASLIFFLFSGIDRTWVITLLSIGMLLTAMFIMWKADVVDAISLLIFFFGTSACFNFFSDVMIGTIPRLFGIAVFALLSLILSNYLLNTVSPQKSADKALYKISLAIIFTEIFWVLSFITANPISKGAVTAVLFLNFLSAAGDILSKNFQKGKFASLAIISIILLAFVIYWI